MTNFPEPRSPETYEIVIPLASAFITNYITFTIASIIKDNSIVDIVWGILFIVPNLVALAVA